MRESSWFRISSCCISFKCHKPFLFLSLALSLFSLRSLLICQHQLIGRVYNLSATFMIISSLHIQTVTTSTVHVEHIIQVLNICHESKSLLTFHPNLDCFLNTKMISSTFLINLSSSSTFSFKSLVR